MTQKKIHSAHVHAAVISLQKYMDSLPLAYRTIEEMWDAYFGASRSMIEKSFRDITGYGLKEYLVYNRLQYSKKMLKDGMSLKRIAVRTHYRSQSAYCSAFKKYFATTPKAWLAAQDHSPDENQKY